jgi:hypothetical protein
VAKAKAVTVDPDEPADPERGDGFAEWVMLLYMHFVLSWANSTVLLWIWSAKC